MNFEFFFINDVQNFSIELNKKPFFQKSWFKSNYKSNLKDHFKVIDINDIKWYEMNLSKHISDTWNSIWVIVMLIKSSLFPAVHPTWSTGEMLLKKTQHITKIRCILFVFITIGWWRCSFRIDFSLVLVFHIVFLLSFFSSRMWFYETKCDLKAIDFRTFIYQNKNGHWWTNRNANTFSIIGVCNII